MKKSVYISIFLVALSVIIAITPFTAFASTDSFDVTSLKRVVQEYYSDENYFSRFPNLVAGYNGSGNIVLVGYDVKPSNAVFGDDNVLRGFSSRRIEFTFDKSNIYKKPTVFVGSGSYATTDRFNSINNSTFDIYDSEGNIYLKQGTVISGSGSSSGTSDNKLSVIVTTNLLNGVLNEIISMLPIILPTLIGFISLRKGLKFVIGILRRA